MRRVQQGEKRAGHSTGPSWPATRRLPRFVLILFVVALFLWLGITYFRRSERIFAGLI
jgi:hypothetical protein